MAGMPKYIDKSKIKKTNIQVRETTKDRLKKIKEEKRLADYDAVIYYLLELYAEVIEGK